MQLVSVYLASSFSAAVCERWVFGDVYGGFSRTVKEALGKPNPSNVNSCSVLRLRNWIWDWNGKVNRAGIKGI